MESKEEQSCLENTNSAKKSKRIRIMTKSAPFSPLESDEDDLFSSSGDSGDEWNVSRKQKCRPSKKTVPKQTLKSKLLEKTKKLRQLSKLAVTSSVVDGCTPAQENVSSISSTDDKKKYCPASPVETKLEYNSNENEITTPKDTKPSLDKLVDKIKCESPVSNIEIKNETKQRNDTECSKKTKNVHERKPIVIEYSTNRFQVSGMSITANFSHSSDTTNYDLSSPSQMSSSISSPAVSEKSTVFENHCDNVCSNNASSQSVNLSYQCARNVSSSQFPSNINAHISPRAPSNPLNVTAANRRKISKTKTTRAPFQRTSAADYQKASTITRLNNVKIVKNHKIGDASVTTPRKMFSANQNLRLSNVDSRAKNNLDVSVVRNATSLKGSCPLLKTSTNHVLNKFRDISPKYGTVIHTGTGSVTITPSKIAPEKPPKQRKLFKNEIEGTISGRNIEGMLRYVVNLANGTFVPLSDLQVEKLREQHAGALPIKLKIPVPCDVAEKIEPSFLIED